MPTSEELAQNCEKVVEEAGSVSFGKGLRLQEEGSSLRGPLQPQSIMISAGCAEELS